MYITFYISLSTQILQLASFRGQIVTNVILRSGLVADTLQAGYFISEELIYSAH